MTHKYATGGYLVYVFDRYGARVREKTYTAPNYTKAREIGKEHKGDGSFAALRVLYNSLDPHPTSVFTNAETNGTTSNEADSPGTGEWASNSV
jgi:hypothetical protein